MQTDVPATKEKLISGKRIGAAISLLIIVPTGFYGKFYSGPAAAWVIAASVLTVTCLLECRQLWHPPFLEVIRSHFIGRTLLGTCFVWSDFLYYFPGAWIGWLWIRRLQNTGKRPVGAPGENI